MDRTVLPVFFAGMLFPLSGQYIAPRPGAFTGGPAPALPYYDWGACPGEGCTYARWAARKSVVVYDTWKVKRRVLTRLAAGDKVIGVTGVVITFKPGVIRIDRDLPDQNLKRGNTILTYAYRGEGESAVWFKGRYYPDFDIGFAKFMDGAGCQGDGCAGIYTDMGRKVWWAEVKLKSGRTGWVDMDNAKFDGVCSLADPHQ